MNAHRMNQKKLAQPSTDQKDAQKVEFLFFVLRLKWNINPEFYDTLRWQYFPDAESHCPYPR